MPLCPGRRLKLLSANRRMIKIYSMYNIQKILLILYFLFTINGVNAQSTTWQRYYDYNHQQNVGTDVVQTYDGGYIILGGAGGTGSIYLLKTDYLGIKQWDKVISDSSTFIGASSIIQTPDSGFAMTGKRGLDVFILKTNKFGNTQWVNFYNRPGGDARSNIIRMTNDQGLVIGASIFFLSQSTSKSYVVKVNNKGGFEWDKLYGDSSFTSSTFILPATNECIYLSNTTKRNASSPFVGVSYKIDKWGEILWKSQFGILKSGIPVLDLDDTATYWAGTYESSSDQKFLITRTNSKGNTLWQNSYDSLFSIGSICHNSKLDIVFAGSKLRNGLQWDFAIAKIDIDGNFIYGKVIDTPQGSEDYCYSIKYTNDDGYILVGTTDFASSGFKDENILAVKTDSGFYSSSIVNVINNQIRLPKKFKLHQNYPNPFNPVTQLEFGIPKLGFVSLKVYDILGKEVMTLVNETKPAGIYKIEFNGSNLSSGVYFYRLESAEFVDIKRMILVK